MNESGIVSKLIIFGGSAFYLEIFIASAIILMYGKKRKLFPLRLIIGLVLSIPFYWLTTIQIGLFSYNYLITLFAIALIFLFIYDESPFVIILSTFAAWGLQHLSWNMAGFLLDLIPNVGDIPQAGLIAILYSVYVVLYGLASFIIYKMKLKISFSRKQVMSFVFGGLIIFLASFLAQLVGTIEGTSWNILFRIYSVICSALALVILIGYPYLADLNQREKELEVEKTNLEKMLILQAHQQEMSKETVDIVNMKFHDLKNQISLLRNQEGIEKEELLSELEKDIDIYSDIARTGNEALDIVITQKSLLCSSKKIRLTYIIDGTAFRFMSKTDITSLFGNILDNAIEAAEQEEDNFRLIKLHCSKRDSFLLIHEENYSHKEITFSKNGMPISSKNDPNFHGYGLRSIHYVTGKYHGKLKISKENDVFMLDVLLPIPVSEEK